MSIDKNNSAENELKDYLSSTTSTNLTTNSSSTTFGKFMGIFRFNRSECDDIKAYDKNEAANANNTDTNYLDLEQGISNLGNNRANTNYVDIEQGISNLGNNVKDIKDNRKSTLEIKIDGKRENYTTTKINRSSNTNQPFTTQLDNINLQTNRISWDSVFVQFMETLARRSLCLKFKTSALVVKGTQIISMGYNGTFNGKKECCLFWLEYYEKHKNDNLSTSIRKTNLENKKDKGILLDTYDALCKQNSSNSQVDDGFVKFINSNDFRMLHRDWSMANEVHAEINALNWIPKGNVDSSYILYTLYSPCDNCAKTIISYGIKNIVYKYKYKHGDMALMRFAENNVKCKQVHE